jgi:hypothetical protein
MLGFFTFAWTQSLAIAGILYLSLDSKHHSFCDSIYLLDSKPEKCWDSVSLPELKALQLPEFYTVPGFQALLMLGFYTLTGPSLTNAESLAFGF